MERTVNESESIIGWVLAGVSSIIAALAGAVAWLGKSQIADYKSIIQECKTEIANLRKLSDICEQDRANIHSDLSVMKERVLWLEKQIGTPKQGGA